MQYLLRSYLKPEGGSYKPEEIRAKLGKFGLPGHNHLTPIEALGRPEGSRGVHRYPSQQSPHSPHGRAHQPPRVQSIDALGDALDEFEGRRRPRSPTTPHICSKVLDNEKSEIWVVDEGRVDKSAGDFDDYRNQLVKEISAELDDDY